MNNLCCGAGGGAWAMPYDEERLAYGKMKADQIKATGAEIVIAPCHNCRDQIMKGLGGEAKKGKMDMGNYKETLYLWELVSTVPGLRALERSGDRSGPRRPRRPVRARRHRVGRRGINRRLNVTNPPKHLLSLENYRSPGFFVAASGPGLCWTPVLLFLCTRLNIQTEEDQP